jgi:chromate transporter
LKELALLFLKLGTVAFGGPAAHIAMMEDEIVQRRRWITREEFLDLLGATNLIPGPNSTEMAAHIGYMRDGWKGLVIAGTCFILPAATISLLFAYLYVAYGAIPQAREFVSGIRLAVIGVILASVVRLAKPHIRNRSFMLIGLVGTALHLLGLNEIVILASSGLLGLMWSLRRRLRNTVAALLLVLPALSPVAAITASAVPAADHPTLAGLALFFLKTGSVLYGSGYVLIAFLQAGLVETRHWLTQSQLLDAIAAGQFSPGPVLSTATFIGYQILGIPGALVSTAAIFIPSFLFVLVSSPFVQRLRRSVSLHGFLDGVNAASVGLMLSVAIILAGSSLTSPAAWIIFLSSVVVVAAWRLNAAWVIAGGAMLGWLLSVVPFWHLA